MRGVDRSQDGGNAAGVLERSDETAAIFAPDPGRASVPACVLECLHGVVDICGEPRNRRIARPDALREQAPQVVESLARLGRDDENRCFAHTVLGEKARDVGTPGVDVPRGEEIGLVQDDRHRLAVGGERAQVLVVQRGVGVLLRLDHPGDEVGEPDDAVDFEPVRGLDRVEVWEVEQDEAVEAVGGEPVAARDLEPVEQRIGAVPPDGGLAGRRRRPAAADRCERFPGERVEELRFPGTGRTGERDDRRLESEAQPFPRTGDDRAGPLDGVLVEPPLRKFGGLAERGESVVENPLHAARRIDSTAPCRRAKLSASGAASSRSASKRAASSRRRRSTRAKRSSRACAASVRTAWSPKIASSTF